jgi:hypothetical protein
MGWVVKSLRTDVLDALRREAERDARRIRRGAGRVAGDVAEQLDALERLGLELRATVRGRRERDGRRPHPSLAEVGPAPHRPEPSAAGPEPAPAGPDPSPGAPQPGEPGRTHAAERPATAARPPRRAGRASLHGSPLTELLRATDTRPRPAAARAERPDRRPARPGEPVA